MLWSKFLVLSHNIADTFGAANEGLTPSQDRTKRNVKEANNLILTHPSDRSLCCEVGSQRADASCQSHRTTRGTIGGSKFGLLGVGIRNTVLNGFGLTGGLTPEAAAWAGLVPASHLRTPERRLIVAPLG